MLPPAPSSDVSPIDVEAELEIPEMSKAPEEEYHNLLALYEEENTKLQGDVEALKRQLQTAQEREQKAILSARAHQAEGTKLRRALEERDRLVENARREVLSSAGNKEQFEAKLEEMTRRNKEQESKIEMLRTENQALRIRTPVKATEDLFKAIESMKGLMRMGMMSKDEVLEKILNFKS